MRLSIVNGACAVLVLGARSGKARRVREEAEGLAVSKKGSVLGSERGAGLPLAEAVYQALRRELTSGTYRPGDRLREDEIAERLRVSRTPVREALGRLVARGLVVPSGSRGLVV